MSIPQSSNQGMNAFSAGFHAVYRAICTATAAFLFILSAIASKVRMVARPIFNPPGSPENGCVGEKPFAPNIRMLFVNGVGTSLEKCKTIATSISRIFNDCLVHYTYAPLRYDQVIRTIMSGHRPSSCNVLLAHIRERLQELHQAEQPLSESDRTVASVSQSAFGEKARLVIFAHSGGGALLEAIREELTPEERQQIDVYSFGSAHLFSPEEGFETVKNAVAGGDPIPAVCRLLDKRIHPLGETWNIGSHALCNISNHSILNDIYQLALWHIRINYMPTS